MLFSIPHCHLPIFLNRDAENADLKKELSGLKLEIERLDSERSTLLSKIAEGDGVNTALQQLKQQNVSSLSRRAHIRHQCRKTTVLSCHRCLINTGVEKMNNI